MSRVFQAGCRQFKKNVLLCDGPVDVRNDDLVVPVPQVDGALAATRPLVLSGYAKGDIIGSISELQAGLPGTCKMYC